MTRQARGPATVSRTWNRCGLRETLPKTSTDRGWPVEIFAETLTLDGESLTVTDVARIARSGSGDAAVDIAESSIAAMKESVALKREMIDRQIPIYGVTTGFGDSC